MLGILVELAISWLLLWLIERKDLFALGIAPDKKRFIQLVGGFALAAACCTIFNIATVAFVNNGWIYNTQISVADLLSSSWWVLRSVLFEELIFRGALLYIAIKRIGIVKACLLSATCFGIYHWFSQNALGHPTQMIFIFIITAIAGWMFAIAFAKTNSLYLPTGLHFGWNVVHIIVFSNGPLGVQLFRKLTNEQPQGVLSILIFLFQVLALPLITWWWLTRRSNNISPVSAK